MCYRNHHQLPQDRSSNAKVPKNMHIYGFLEEVCIPPAETIHMFPEKTLFQQCSIYSDIVIRTGSARYDGEYSPLYLIFWQE